MSTYVFVRKSANAKLGPMPATITSQDSCPGSCPLKGRGCYASMGPLSWHWRKMTNHMPLAGLCSHIRELPENTLWRMNVAGDLAGDGEAIDEEKLRQLVEANRGRRGFTYTHKKYGTTNCGRPNLDAIAWANENGFTVNVSADSLEEADSLLDTGAAPVVCILPRGTSPPTTPKGVRVVICPATRKDGIHCVNCGLCQRVGRNVVIGFPAHGARAGEVERVFSQGGGRRSPE